MIFGWKGIFSHKIEIINYSIQFKISNKMSQIVNKLTSKYKYTNSMKCLHFPIDYGVWDIRFRKICVFNPDYLFQALSVYSETQ